MKIAVIAPPFIPVPPKAYGGTELFVAQLAEGLSHRGHDVIVYGNGESTVDCDVRWVYGTSTWPPASPGEGTLMQVHHSAWALRDAEAARVDVVHLNDAIAVPMSRFLPATPMLLTLHHPHDETLSALYEHHPDVNYIAISNSQRLQEKMPLMRTIHHGLQLEKYAFREHKDEYLCFLGRIAPMKGAHVAVEIARRTGIPLKIGGEIQPAFRSYWESQVAPYVDGRLIEYIGEASPSIKNELLSRSRALLFPISWEEPFGLVMIEAMACGTPVLAFAGGAVREVVSPGVSGWICRDAEELAERACDPGISPASCRDYIRRRFSIEQMVERYIAAYEAAAGLDGAVVSDASIGVSPGVPASAAEA
jgi:glycosyltransferase involved in cell wall biosynthesis